VNSSAVRTLLVLDTATRTPVAALATSEGAVVAARSWQSRHRHGEELLQRIDEVLAEAGTARAALAGVVVGTGPGSFTGLRIGLATAKTIAYSLGVPMCGVSSTEALALAALATEPDLDELVVTLPAGASDRYEHRFRIDARRPIEIEPPQLVAEPPSAALPTAAVDIETDVPEDALARGRQAVGGLAQALATLGAARLAAGGAEDVAQLVPAYVALPRGIARAVAEMEWSPDLR
jgi:tRNA threonylcarbamoyladenosine biosynthesis protein TsaB